MKLKVLFFVGILLMPPFFLSAKYDVTLTSGIFGGIPFWNIDNFSEDYAMEPSLKFLRWYNNISASGHFGDFSLHFSGSRSDGFDIRDDIPESNKYQVHFFDSKYHFTDTRIYKAYAQYKFDGGNVRAGRIPVFSRWLFGSVDGAEASYNITDKFSVSAFGGKGVKYGMFYDDEYDNTAGYGELSYKMKGFGAKLKYLYSDEASKTGMDLYGCIYGIKVSANFGYDITNKELFDGSLGLYGNIGEKLSLSANLSRFKPLLIFRDLYSPVSGQKITSIATLVTDRVVVGASYKLFDVYSISFRQMAAVRDANTDFLSYLCFAHKYFYIGINYLSGVTKHDTLEDSSHDRLGISVGGNYSPFKGFRINAGIGSVDYMMDGTDAESVNSIATYLKFDWELFDNLALNTNLNYYHNNKAFDQKFRGGLTLQYRIQSGESK